MRRYDLWFLVLAAACLVVGVLMGIAMGVVHDFRLSPVHGHLNLLGWTSLALFGLAYKAYPSLGASRLAGLHFALAAPSAVLFPVGIYVSIAYQTPLVAIIASLLWLAGSLAFLAGLVRAFLAAPARVASPGLRPLPGRA